MSTKAMKHALAILALVGLAGCGAVETVDQGSGEKTGKRLHVEWEGISWMDTFIITDKVTCAEYLVVKAPGGDIAVTRMETPRLSPDGTQVCWRAEP